MPLVSNAPPRGLPQQKVPNMENNTTPQTAAEIDAETNCVELCKKIREEIALKAPTPIAELSEKQRRLNYEKYSSFAYGLHHKALELMHELGDLAKHPGTTIQESDSARKALREMFKLSNRLYAFAIRAENTKYEHLCDCAYYDHPRRNMPGF